MSDNKPDEFNSNPAILSDEYLHQNYLKILKFAFPDEAIKEWVKNDSTHHGSYHKDIDWIFPVVQKIESLSTRPVPIDFIIGNGLVEVRVYESLNSDRYHFLYKELYATTFEDKTFAIYKVCIAFIDWFNAVIHNETFVDARSSPYTSPYSLHSNSDNKKSKRLFPDNLAIDHLMSIAAKAFDTTVEKMRTKTRKAEVVKARQLCMTIINIDGRGLCSTGSLFGKDHATVLHAKRSILNIIDTQDKEFYGPVMEVLEIFDLVDKLKNQAP